MEILQNIIDILLSGWRVLQIIILLSVLIIGHEYGHFIIAKLSGMRVDEFAVGFGRRLWSFTRGETTYCLNIFPLGGYCKIYGMDVEDEEELKKQAEEAAKQAKNGESPKQIPVNESIAPKDDPRAFVNRPLYQRFGVIIAGPTANFLIAILMVFIMGITIGYPAAELGNIIPGGPADVAGLMTGDIITHLNGAQLASTDDLLRAVRFNQAEALYLSGIRGNEEFDVAVIPQQLRLVDSNFCRLGFIYMNDGSVIHVQPGSPSGRAGLLPGDILLVVDGLRFPSHRLEVDSGSGLMKLSVYRDYRRKFIEIDYFNSEINRNTYSSFGFFYDGNHVITQVLQGGIADDTGLISGDVLAGGELRTWSEIEESRADPVKAITLIYERDGRTHTAHLEPDTSFSRIQVYMDDASIPVLTNLPFTHRLYQAGLRNGDKILSVAGVPTPNGIAAFLEFQKHFGESTTIVAISDSSERVFTVPIPGEGSDLKELKVFFGGLHFRTTYFSSGFLNSLATGYRKAVDITSFIFMTLGMLISGEASIKDLAGPVGIVTYTYQAATSGFVDLINMMVLLSINLAIFNLLPFPALDGGRIIFMIPELILKRQVITPRIENLIHLAGFALLIMLAALVAYNDVVRLIVGR